MISGMLLNNHFRYKLKLGAYGRGSTYLAVVAAPVAMSALFHAVVSILLLTPFKWQLYFHLFQFVQSNIYLRKYDCPLCLQTRAALLQLGTGLFYPLVLAPVASFMFATRHFTYKLPSPIEKPKEILQLALKFTKSAGTMTGVLFGVNALVAMLLTARAMSEHAYIMQRLEEHEKLVDAGMNSNLDLN